MVTGHGISGLNRGFLTNSGSGRTVRLIRINHRVSWFRLIRLLDYARKVFLDTSVVSFYSLVSF